jgi:hypothetical protein
MTEKRDVGEAPKAHDWVFDGRVMFCRRCFRNTHGPGRIGSEMDTECPGFGKVRITRLPPLKKEQPR